MNIIVMDAAFAALRGGISFDKRQSRGMNVFQVRASAVASLAHSVGVRRLSTCWCSLCCAAVPPRGRVARNAMVLTSVALAPRCGRRTPAEAAPPPRRWRRRRR